MLRVREINGSEGTVPVEGLHGQGVSAHDIPLADLDHYTTIGENSPRSIKEFSDQRVDNGIDASAVGLSHDLACEFRATRREHAVSWNSVFLLQELALLLGAHGHIDLRRRHALVRVRPITHTCTQNVDTYLSLFVLSELDASNSDTTSCGVNEHRLHKELLAQVI